MLLPSRFTNAHPRRARQSIPLVIVLAALLVPSAPALCQVGYPPSRSPYRDIDAKYILTLVGGYAAGDGGRIDVGPSTGRLGGIRFDLHLSGPGVAQFNINYGSLERKIIDPDAPPEERDLGTANQSILFADAGLDMVLTGAKTWHGLAPYVGASVGIALGGSVPEDSVSGFDFSTRFMVGPQIGFRWHPHRRIVFRVEGRTMIWRLSYPGGFFEAPERAPDADPVLDLEVHGETQWVHNPMLMVSLGFVIPG
ncbi:MAG: hypothetical protein PVF27_05925 [Gemmatimonadales bacterium]|jgi:hypothetical protein